VSDGLLHARQSGYEVELSITGEHEHASIRCPMVGLPLHSMTISSCTTSGHTLMWFDAGISGIVSATGAGTFVQVDHRFKFPDAWNDESSAILSVALVSQQGPMIPLSYDFGLGTAQGVENDLEVRWWAPVSQLGIPSSEAYPYLRPGEAISIEVQLGFEHGLEGTPRSGQALVRLLIDGNEYATTTTFVNGKATFPYAIPSGRTSLEIGIEVLPMRGQDVTSAMALTNVYRFDTTAPRLISSDVDTFDTRDAAPATSLKFSIADQPNLPTYAFAHLWRSWQDDADGNGMMTESEMSVLALDLPSDLSQQ